MAKYQISLKRIIKDFELETMYMPETEEEIMVETASINRPGLNFTGFWEYFDPKRIQIYGRIENTYLLGLEETVRNERLEHFFSYSFPAMVVTRGLAVDNHILEMAKKYGVAVLRTGESSASTLSNLISYLNVHLAERITRHGVLVEIYGEGIFITGDSGIGKSETAVELIKRGHRLVADDAVEIRKVSNRSLVGSSPENIRYFVEMRGIGIVNARRLFGMSSIKMTEKIDMVVNLELWNAEKNYDRLGMEDEYTTIMGIKVPSLTIPVKPGRNLAIILEVAAMNNRQKKMGYNAAQELMQSLGMPVDTTDASGIKNWDFF